MKKKKKKKAVEKDTEKDFLDMVDEDRKGKKKGKGKDDDEEEVAEVHIGPKMSKEQRRAFVLAIRAKGK